MQSHNVERDKYGNIEKMGKGDGGCLPTLAPRDANVKGSMTQFVCSRVQHVFRMDRYLPCGTTFPSRVYSGRTS